MKKQKTSLKSILFVVLLIAAFFIVKTFFPELLPFITNDDPGDPAVTTTTSPDPEVLDVDGVYTSKEDVALYIFTYHKLPSNFITKSQAEALGWPGGKLDPYAYGKCIGGDTFGNMEGLLPSKKGRSYKECDIDTLHANSRGSKRIVYSNDGLIYYTDDHYDSFTLLYGNP